MLRLAIQVQKFQHLKIFHFQVKPGETTAIIGGTGSGKITLLKLIPRFYEVDSGIDSCRWSKYKRHDLRGSYGKRSGSVPQKASFSLEP